MINKRVLICLLFFLPSCVSTSYTKLLNDTHEEYWTKESYLKAEQVIEQLEPDKSTYSDLANELPILISSIDNGRVRFYVANGWLKDLNHFGTTDTTSKYSMIFGYIDQGQVHVKYKIKFNQEAPNLISDIQKFTYDLHSLSNSNINATNNGEYLTKEYYEITKHKINNLTEGTDFFELLRLLDGAIFHERMNQNHNDFTKGIKSTFLVGLFGYSNVKQPIEYKHTFNLAIPALIEIIVDEDGFINWVFGYEEEDKLESKIKLSINNWKLYEIEYL
ncbi:MAG: hypothetical protein JJ966_12015 [Balneolaceae bacterium]|nr:hypothetical protein [Balneolaceae bacterium]